MILWKILYFIQLLARSTRNSVTKFPFQTMYYLHHHCSPVYRHLLESFAPHSHSTINDLPTTNKLTHRSNVDAILKYRIQSSLTYQDSSSYSSSSSFNLYRYHCHICIPSHLPFTLTIHLISSTHSLSQFRNKRPYCSFVIYSAFPLYTLWKLLHLLKYRSWSNFYHM